MNIITDREAIRCVLNAKDRFVCYLGAGVSVEAGVKSAQAICEEIHTELVKDANITHRNDKKQILKWQNETLLWDKLSRRYLKCIQERYKNEAERIAYFRKILQGKQPCFCHHGIALLITNGYLKQTCLTTNFDKLLENAFTQQGNLECQPIRTDVEAQYREDIKDRSYLIKLHGDYDTHNILNTYDETIAISENKREIIKKLLQYAGLVVIGTAGNEESIHTMFKELSSDKAASEKVLSYGLLWGIYMGSPKPQNMSDDEIINLVKKRIEHDEVVSEEIIRTIERAGHKNDRFCFFPVWGSGNFMFDLIKTTENRTIIEQAELYLDQRMRLRNVFTRAGLSDEAISKHIKLLEERQHKISSKSGSVLQETELVFTAIGKLITINVHFGDITDRSLMTNDNFKNLRRAIISPDDTCISAGGGAAFLLLKNAGTHNILNEISKFSQIEHCSIAVTSGGKLPVHYIFHAAAVKIQENKRKEASYLVSKDDVRKTMLAALTKAVALEVGVLWVPLMGAGVASLKPWQSLDGILEAIRTWKPQKHTTIEILIYKEKELERNRVQLCLKRKLKSAFTVYKKY